MERMFIKVLRLQGIQRRLARFLLLDDPSDKSHKREEAGVFEGFAKKCRLSVQQAVRFFVKYIVCLPLGLVTFGSFWTIDIRKFFLYNHSDMGLDEFEMRRKEMESLKEANITLLQLQEKQSEQMAFVREENREVVQLQTEQFKQMASLREANLKLMELQITQAEKIEDTSQKLAEATVLLVETCKRLGSIKQKSERPSEQKS
jgi:hypothetical protein